jgi:DNA-binding transcriptional ArsR family regulator
LKALAVVSTTALDRSTFERITRPSLEGGQRVAGLRFGAQGTMRLLEAVGCAGLSFRAFSNEDLRAVLGDRLGAPAGEVTPSTIGYALRKLRGKGLIRKAQGRNRYTLTDLGYRVAIYFTKLHQRLLSPTLDAFDGALRASVASSTHPIDQAVSRLNEEMDLLARTCGLKIPA